MKAEEEQVVEQVRAPRDLHRALDDRIQTVVELVDAPVLREATRHVLRGGKRVRPLLCMLACAAAGGREWEALDPAAAVELLHTASLVHDDIMDGSDLRRGEATLNATVGTDMAILAGDALVAMAFQVLTRSVLPRKSVLLEEFSTAYLTLCEGQCEDIAPADARHLHRGTHRGTVRKKTAELVGSSMAMGAMVATRRESTIDALRRVGIHLGMAYQAKDDLLEVVGDEQVVGKRLGTDVRNGRRTFLTMACPGPDVQVGVEDLVGQYTRRALEELDSLPPSPAKNELAGLARSLARREA